VKASPYVREIRKWFDISDDVFILEF